MNEYRVVIDLVNCETGNFIGTRYVPFTASTNEQIVYNTEDIVNKNRDCDFGGYTVEILSDKCEWLEINYSHIFSIVNARVTSEEIAIKLYELSKDLDFEDYEDTRESDIKTLENAIYNLKLYANSSNDFDELYNVLESLYVQTL